MSLIRKSFTAVVVAAALFTAGACGGTDSDGVGAVGSSLDLDTPPVVDTADMGESVYLETLKQGGIQYSSDAAALKVGHGVCDYIREGSTSIDAAMFIQGNSPYSSYEAGYIVGASTGALCPELAGR